MGYVYCFRVGQDNCFKIGRTRTAPLDRLRGVSVGSAQKLAVYRTLETDDAVRLEKYIHWLLDAARAPNGEFFYVNERQLDEAIDTAVASLARSAAPLREAQRLRRKPPARPIAEPSTKARELHRALRDATRQAFLLEQQILYLQAELQLEIGENAGLAGIASWKWREQWTLDQRLLRKEEPQMFEKYRKMSGARVFRLE